MSGLAIMNDNKSPGSQAFKNRRGRSIAIAVSLALVVLLVYLVTVFKLGAGVVSRPL